MKTDSPTPAESQTTPTTKVSTAIKLKRMSRNRSGLLSVKSEVEDGNESIGLSEDTQSSTQSAEAPKTPNTRTKKLAAKEEEANGDVKDAAVVAEEEEEDPEKEEEEDAGKDVDSPRRRRLTKAQMLKKKGAELAKARRLALIKRQSLPVPAD